MHQRSLGAAAQLYRLHDDDDDTNAETITNESEEDAGHLRVFCA